MNVKRVFWLLFRAVASCGVVAVVLTVSGCGSVSDVPLVDVYGTISLEGKPLKFAEVIFMPLNRKDGDESKGTTDENGNYTLLFPGNHRGAIKGEHRVAIRAYEFKGDVDPRSADLDEADVRSMGHLRRGGGHQDLVQIVPKEFSEVGSSVLRASVSDDNRRIDFELQSKAGVATSAAATRGVLP